MFKKILSFLLITLSILPMGVFAEELENNDGSEQIVEIVDEAIKLDLSITNQNFPAKEITFKIVIKPEINIARAQLAWIYNDRIFVISGSSTELLNLKAGEEVVLYKTFNTKRIFSFNENLKYEIGAKVTGLAFDKNYLSSRKVSFSINKDFELLPLLSDYQQQKTIITTIYWLLAIIAGIVVIWLIILGIRKFKAYLESD